MNDKPDRNDPQASDQLHPVVYKALAGLAIWLVASAWLFFSQGGYLALNLAIVSVLVFMVIAIPTVIHQAGGLGDTNRVAPFQAWLSGDFDMRQGRRKSLSASIEILLPLAAAVIGLTAIGIIFRLTEIYSA